MAAADANTTVSSLSLATLLHMLTIKVLNYHLQTTCYVAIRFYPYLLIRSLPVILTGRLLLRASKEMAEALGFKSAREVWCALEATYSHDYVERMHTLHDSLRHL
ncbi:zinc finger, CCHC-type, Gag-polypeptide of LTR copia-type [Artemisia annua]|uniref:Zinc finger, CCHC-type, Gag-polypeptide of LTR copia-type n=1 Tax=Artemisia annua TaxID=35608 RepID=A0A2U1L193_ARTAN|nr:zinc finger, CCHC-type, Gag-polypeptide of LTR copia-type [Artemisia annua]